MFIQTIIKLSQTIDILLAKDRRKITFLVHPMEYEKILHMQAKWNCIVINFKVLHLNLLLRVAEVCAYLCSTPSSCLVPRVTCSSLLYIFKYYKTKLCTVLTDSHLKENSVILVFSKLGISRSAAIVMAYLMAENKWSPEASF